jgi:antitoxin MazE
MHAKIIVIGTSRGIRIPKYLLDKYALNNDVDVEDTGSGILIKAAKKARAGWKEACEKAMKTTRKSHVISMPTSAWDKDEWEW